MKRSCNGVFPDAAHDLFRPFPVDDGIGCLAEPVVRLLLTDKWIRDCSLDTYSLLRLDLVAGSNMSWQLLNAKHRSDYCLKAEIIKKVIAISILVFSLFWGIKVVCIGMLLYYVADVYVITVFSARVLPGVTFASEMKSMLPILAYAAVMGTGVTC